VTDLMQWHMNLLVVTVGLQYCAETDSHWTCHPWIIVHYSTASSQTNW
jgi:hypothetical protein